MGYADIKVSAHLGSPAGSWVFGLVEGHRIGRHWHRGGGEGVKSGDGCRAQGKEVRNTKI